MTATTPFADRFAFEAHGFAHPVYREGHGPLVLLLHELPGMIPEFWRLARWLVGAGFTVWAPDLWGGPDEEAPVVPGLAKGTARMCVSREIHAFAANRSSPVTDYLRALVARAGEEGHERVGVVGLCMTGNFALSLVTEARVAAAVASEPAMPIGPWQRATLHLDAREKAALAARTEVPVLAARFAGDPLCTAGKLASLRAVVGERLEEIVVPDGAKNPDGNPFPHAVLTKDLIDEAGQPTVAARDRVIAMLREALRADASAGR